MDQGQSVKWGGSSCGLGAESVKWGTQAMPDCSHTRPREVSVIACCTPGGGPDGPGCTRNLAPVGGSLNVSPGAKGCTPGIQVLMGQL